MTNLQMCLQQLFTFLTNSDLSPPSRDVRLIEIPGDAVVDGLGRLRLFRENLHELSEYEAQFEAIMNSGFPWINVSCYGIYEDHLIVAIEIPKMEVSKGSSRRSSVNYSGPSKAVVEQGWDISPIVVFE